MADTAGGRLRDVGDLPALKRLLGAESQRIRGGFDEMTTFGLTQNNKRLVRYLLARLTSFAETGVGQPDRIADYLDPTRPFEIEHIWANDFEQYRAEAKQRRNFDIYRNRLGALLLLPKSDNASYGAVPYTRKLDSYVRQNVLAAALHPNTHKHNPRLRRFIADHGLPALLHPHPDGFDKEAIDTRQLLYQRLCSIVWSPERLGLTLPDQLAVPEPAPKPSRPTPARRTTQLAKLLGAGRLAPGERLIGVKRASRGNPEQVFEAIVSADGRVQLPTGEALGDPTEARAAVLSQKTCRGWEFWHVLREGQRVPLKVIRDAK